MKTKRVKKKRFGKHIFPVEINITRFGLWLCLHDEEFFLTYEEYPFFKNAAIPDIYDVELQHETHLYWPTLDVDLNVAILKNPHHFPLIAH
ncbi:MAG TPA: DUF2442 domain-containing protein [Chlamydiales bacterium]|nr:DUF2442 domain-containing protein [Chlamydiales bacterium]